MFLEPFSAEMRCPVCGRKEPHLIELDSIHFKEKIITFLAHCSHCNKVEFMMSGNPALPMMYKCTYQYWDEIEPLEDKPNPN